MYLVYLAPQLATKHMERERSGAEGGWWEQKKILGVREREERVVKGIKVGNAPKESDGVMGRSGGARGGLKKGRISPQTLPIS